MYMRNVNGFLTLFWVAMIPVSWAAGWLNSVTYVSTLALWSLVSSHWSTWQAARVEVAHERAQEELESDPLEDRVVQRLVEKTEIEQADG